MILMSKVRRVQKVTVNMGESHWIKMILVHAGGGVFGKFYKTVAVIIKLCWLTL